MYEEVIHLKKSGGGGGSGLTLKGDIAVSGDFPTLALVKMGRVYRITANVTDNDPTKTNTGLSFKTGDIIYRTGTTWLDITGLEVWLDDGTNVIPLNSRNVNIETGKEYRINNINLVDDDVALSGGSSTRVASQRATKIFAIAMSCAL